MPTPNSSTEATSSANLDSVNQVTSLSELNTYDYIKGLKNFRVLKSLGSKINSVHPFHTKGSSGFLVDYADGDMCLADPKKTYRSRIRYLCNPDGDDVMVDYPLIEVPPTVGEY